LGAGVGPTEQEIGASQPPYLPLGVQIMVIARTLFESLWSELLKIRLKVTGVTIVTGAPDARGLSMCDITIMPGECLPGGL